MSCVDSTCDVTYRIHRPPIHLMLPDGAFKDVLYRAANDPTIAVGPFRRLALLSGIPLSSLFYVTDQGRWRAHTTKQGIVNEALSRVPFTAGQSKHTSKSPTKPSRRRGRHTRGGDPVLIILDIILETIKWFGDFPISTVCSIGLAGIGYLIYLLYEYAAAPTHPPKHFYVYVRHQKRQADGKYKFKRVCFAKSPNLSYTGGEMPLEDLKRTTWMFGPTYVTDVVPPQYAKIPIFINGKEISIGDKYTKENRGEHTPVNDMYEVVDGRIVAILHVYSFVHKIYPNGNPSSYNHFVFAKTTCTWNETAQQYTLQADPSISTGWVTEKWNSLTGKYTNTLVSPPPAPHGNAGGGVVTRTYKNLARHMREALQRIRASPGAFLASTGPCIALAGLLILLRYRACLPRVLQTRFLTRAVTKHKVVAHARDALNTPTETIADAVQDACRASPAAEVRARAQRGFTAVSPTLGQLYAKGALRTPSDVYTWLFHTRPLSTLASGDKGKGKGTRRRSDRTRVRASTKSDTHEAFYLLRANGHVRASVGEIGMAMEMVDRGTTQDTYLATAHHHPTPRAATKSTRRTGS